MSPLGAALLSLLQNESGMPPLAAASISNVLWCTGGEDAGRRYTVAEIETACEELMTAGHVERITTRRLGPRYRAMPKAGSAPGAASDPRSADPSRPAAPQATISRGALFWDRRE